MTPKRTSDQRFIQAVAAPKGLPSDVRAKLESELIAAPFHRMSKSSLPSMSFATTAAQLRLSPTALRRSVFVLLLALGLSMIVESVLSLNPIGFVPQIFFVRLLIALAFGVAIGAVSGLLGVAGGENIIPILILGFGAPVKVAGSLSQMVSIPTVMTGFARHFYGGALSDRAMILGLVVPMGLGAIAGAILGGMLASIAPAALLKALLGLILVGSAIKVFAK